MDQFRSEAVNGSAAQGVMQREEMKLRKNFVATHIEAEHFLRSQH